ncbi:hypothetical protein [Planctobacterium marinum]|nr:hypothetical protein [Planctobacterium marinum]
MATVTKADRVKQRALAAVAGAKVQGYKLAAKAQTAKARARSN